MKKKLVVFPGWGSESGFYEETFGKEVLIIKTFDTDEIVAELKKYKEDSFVFLAWSMGTIKLIEILNIYLEAKAIFISPTLNFKKQSSEKLIKNMIEGIAEKKEFTLKRFIKRNFSANYSYKLYCEKYFESIKKIKKEELLKGLDFLEKTSIENIKLKNVQEHLIIIAGKDKIISEISSIEFSEKIDNKEIIKFENSGHNIIFEKKDEVLKIVRSFMNDKKK